MAQGNNSKREGAKSHELYVLQALNRIKEAITGGGLPPAPTGLATETTLQAVNAELDAIKVDTANLDVALSTRATEATLDAFATANSNENGAISAELASLLLALTTFATENGTDLDEVKAKLDEVSNDISDFESSNGINLDSIITLLTSTTATESTLQGVQALLGTIDADTTSIDTKLTDGTQISKITSNTAKDGTGTDLYPLLDADGHLQVDIVSGGSGGGASNVIDSNNSTATPLGAGAVFTGTGTDVSTYNSVTIQLFADQDSAVDGMSFQFSPDNVNWDEQNDYNLEIAISQTRRFQFPVTAQYFRVVYTNGGVAQTAFRVQTILHTSDVLTSIHRLDTGLTNDRSVTVTKSVIAGETSAGGGAFLNVKVAPSGSLETNANQDTHDNLNANANIQVGDVDVSGANPVPTTMASTTVTPNLVRSTGAGTIPVGARSFSIANVGAADADILGGINNLKAGEVVNFDAGLNNTYGLVVYDATGTELLITYNS